MIKKLPMFLSLFFAFIIAVLTYAVTLSTATLAFSFTILLFGFLFTILVTNKTQRLPALNLFFIVFSIYVLLAINYFLGYQANWEVFSQDWRDEYKFFLITERNQYLTINQLFIDIFVNRDYLEYAGYVFYISTISSISNSLFDGNHLLLQMLGTVVFGVLTSVVLFKIFNLYFEQKKAFYYVLVFMLFSVFNYYTSSLLRDVFIAFLYTCGFYLILSDRRKSKLSSFIVILLINALVWELRFENGIFFGILTSYFVFKNFRSNKIVLSVFGLLFLVLVFKYSLPYLNKAVNTIDRYSDFTSVSVEAKQDSLGRYIYRLPPVAKQTAAIINSQVQPFPSWLMLYEAENIHRAISGILQIFHAFFWFIIFFSLVKWGGVEKKFNILKNELLVLSLICLIFLFLNTANITIRRIMAFYPFIYFLYAFIRERSVSDKNKLKTTLMAMYIYLFFVFIYLVLKL